MQLIQILDNGEEKLLLEAPSTRPALFRNRLWGESGLKLPSTVRSVTEFNRELRGLPFVVRESASTHNFKWQKGTTSKISPQEEKFWKQHQDGQLTADEIAELKKIRRIANSRNWDSEHMKKFSLYINPELFNEFKELATKEGMSVSKAFNILMEHSINYVKECDGKLTDYRKDNSTDKA